MATLRLFAAAREAAGHTSDEIEAPTVGDLLDEACRRYGDRFLAVLLTSRVWVNGQPAEPATPVVASDVVAVLPPVSGGAQAAPEPARPARRAVPTATPRRHAHRASRLPAAAPPTISGNLALVPDPIPDPDPADGPPQPSGGPSSPAKPRPTLAVVHRSVRPHGRLGLAWAGVTVGLTVAGPGWLAGWLAVAAFFAAAQTAMAWRKRKERPLIAHAAALAAALPVAAAFDARAMNGVVVVGMAAVLVARLRAPTRAPTRDAALTLVIGVTVGLAAASPVLLRRTSVPAALLLLAFAAVYDAGAYLVGTGAASAWEGPAAGVAACIPLTIFAAVVFIPPFAGAEPFLLGLLAALLAPVGPLAGSALLGDSAAHAPALRRLDSLLLLGPVWAWCAAALLR